MVREKGAGQAEIGLKINIKVKSQRAERGGEMQAKLAWPGGIETAVRRLRGPRAAGRGNPEPQGGLRGSARIPLLPGHSASAAAGRRPAFG